MKNPLKFAFVMLIVWLMAACEKQPINSSNTGSFNLEFEHVWGTGDTPFFLNEVYVQPSTGDTISIHTLKFYISNLRLRKTDGSYWQEPNSYHLISPERNELEIALIPNGDYTNLEFEIGIDSSQNSSGLHFGDLDTSNGMFWNVTKGFIFIKIEGSSPQANNHSFSYHIGGYQSPFNAINSRQFSFGSEVMGISPNANPKIHLKLNVSDVWNGAISLKNTNIIQVPGNNAVSFAKAFAEALQFEHLHQ